MGAMLAIGPGDIFWDWTLVEEVARNPKTNVRRWRVRCKCGATCVRDQGNITSGQSKQCARCGNKARIASVRKKRGERHSAALSGLTRARE